MAEKNTAPAATEEQKFRLTVHKSGEDKAPMIQVGVNGKIWHIKKGVEVIVPESVVEVLRNAIKDVYTQEGGTLVQSELHSYPFSASPV